MDDSVFRIQVYWVWQARSRRLDSWRYFPSVHPWRARHHETLYQKSVTGGYYHETQC